MQPPAAPLKSEPAWLTALRPRVEVQVVRDIVGADADVQLAAAILSDLHVLAIGAFGWWEAPPSAGGRGTVLRYPLLLEPMPPFFGIPERGDARVRAKSAGGDNAAAAAPRLWDKRVPITIVQAAEGDLKGA